MQFPKIFPSHAATRFLGVLSLILASCTVYEAKSQGGSGGNTEGEKGIALFEGKAPSLDATSWAYQTGVEKSASGALNPVFLDSEKTPLRTPGTRIWLNRPGPPLASLSGAGGLG